VATALSPHTKEGQGLIPIHVLPLPPTVMQLMETLKLSVVISSLIGHLPAFTQNHLWWAPVTLNSISGLDNGINPTLFNLSFLEDRASYQCSCVSQIRRWGCCRSRGCCTWLSCWCTPPSCWASSRPCCCTDAELVNIWLKQKGLAVVIHGSRAGEASWPRGTISYCP